MTMTKALGSVGLVLLLAAGSAGAQETRGGDESPEAPRTKLRVLEHPYDIASFYRSSQSYEERFFGYEGGYQGGYQAPRDFSDRYPIAGYYRSGQERRMGRFGPYWNSGTRRPRLLVGYQRPLGSHADLFLVTPTFLAPVGPLTAAFFGAQE